MNLAIARVANGPWVRNCAVALMLGLAVVTAACGSIGGAPPAATSSATGTDSALGERRSETAAVTIAASWLADAAPAVRVVMDTHSVDLDGFDLKTLARVRLDGGPWAVPSSWDAAKGGHHREGTLTFGSLDRRAVDAAALIELEVRDVAAPSRILRWERPR